MIEKIQKPIKFDSEQNFLVVARDGEKFYVASESVLKEDPNMELIEMGARSLLQWALEVNYPIRKFIRLQKLLVEKYFEK
jgi:hypothetical protein